MSQSILDQVMSVQKMSAISNFDPEDIAGKLFSVLNEREADIITKRYGLHGGEKVTLEEIGNNYNVTRERIRQVENASLKRIRDAYHNSVLKELEFVVRNILEDHGYLMSEDRLIDLLLVADKNTDKNNALIRFVLNQLLHDRFNLAKEDTHIYKAWSLDENIWKHFHDVVGTTAKIIDEHGEPMSIDQLMSKAREQVKLMEELEEKYEQVLMNYLTVTKRIEENKFNEWGLANWSSIRPRRMNDKIYLIMKKEGKPLHFTEIANRINEAKFDNRIAYPATIHNELILDNKYVLVGRGIYALREWGYKPGVVLDVIREILRQNGRSMSRDEIIDQVLKNRLVKRSTVILALMNKKYFAKDGEGRYTAVE